MERGAAIDSQARTVRQTSAGWMLKRLSASLDAEMSERLKDHGLSINQFAVIMTLLEEEGLTQTEIGNKIEMPGYSTTRTIDALEEKLLLERRPDTRSRRSRRIYLTDRGRALAPELFGIVRRVNTRLLRPLGEREREMLIALLEKLLRSRLT